MTAANCQEESGVDEGVRYRSQSALPPRAYLYEVTYWEFSQVECLPTWPFHPQPVNP